MSDAFRKDGPALREGAISHAQLAPTVERVKTVQVSTADLLSGTAVNLIGADEIPKDYIAVPTLVVARLTPLSGTPYVVADDNFIYSGAEKLALLPKTWLAGHGDDPATSMYATPTLGHIPLSEDLDASIALTPTGFSVGDMDLVLQLFYKLVPRHI